MNKNNPIIISGPSGAGKSLLIKCIEELSGEEYKEAMGCTTREKRSSDNEKMYFLSKKEFEKMISNNEFIEYTRYCDNYYGTPKSELKKLEKNSLLFSVGYSAAKAIKEIYRDSILIYLLPPNKEELRRRLGNREEERFLLGKKETEENALKYEYLLISKTDNLKLTYKEFLDIVKHSDKALEHFLNSEINREFVTKFYN